MSQNAIEVKDVTKIYRLYDRPIDRLKESLSLTHKSLHKDFYALNGLSFTVEKGQTVGIIGTNGSGKSTILKIITGVLTPTTGSMPGIKAFTAAVFGGIGSIPGAVIGGFIIGICESLIKGAGATTFSDAFTFALLIVVLAVKPTGLFSENLTEKV